jgi:hypothetical protein
MSLPEMRAFSAAIRNGDTQAAEDALEAYFTDKRAQIERHLETAFPDREPVLRRAFAAHDRGEYELSIPVMLIQADGICSELIGVQLFRRRDKVPATAAYVQKLPADTFRAALLHPLEIALPISASADERQSASGLLHRHAVLHGVDTSYGSLRNSLRALSLLNYVATVLAPADQSAHTDAA